MANKYAQQVKLRNALYGAKPDLSEKVPISVFKKQLDDAKEELKILIENNAEKKKIDIRKRIIADLEYSMNLDKRKK